MTKKEDEKLQLLYQIIIMIPLSEQLEHQQPGQDGQVRQMGNNTADESEFNFSPDDNMKDQQQQQQGEEGEGEQDEEEEEGDELADEGKKNFVVSLDPLLIFFSHFTKLTGENNTKILKKNYRSNKNRR